MWTVPLMLTLSTVHNPLSDLAKVVTYQRRVPISTKQDDNQLNVLFDRLEVQHFSAASVFGIGTILIAISFT